MTCRLPNKRPQQEDAAASSACHSSDNENGAWAPGLHCNACSKGKGGARPDAGQESPASRTSSTLSCIATQFKPPEWSASACPPALPSCAVPAGCFSNGGWHTRHRALAFKPSKKAADATAARVPLRDITHLFAGQPACGGGLRGGGPVARCSSSSGSAGSTATARPLRHIR